jgi:uncharacterized membrane protein (DUF106 family)
MLEPIYQVLDSILGVFFKLSNNDSFNVMFGVLVMAILISAIIVFITSKVVDQREIRKMKEKMSKLQEKAREAQKKNDAKELSKINKELLAMQSKMMSNSIRPMLFTMVPIILIFSWMRQYHYLTSYIESHGYLVALPFSLPIWGSKLEWLGWYILCSIPASSLIRKILKVEM